MESPYWCIYCKKPVHNQPCQEAIRSTNDFTIVVQAKQLPYYDSSVLYRCNNIQEFESALQQLAIEKGYKCPHCKRNNHPDTLCFEETVNRCPVCEQPEHADNNVCERIIKNSYCKCCDGPICSFKDPLKAEEDDDDDDDDNVCAYDNQQGEKRRKE
jgi:hypothetical protein